MWSHLITHQNKDMEILELWTDETLGKFLEDNKRDVGGLTVYPKEEWAEKVMRNLKRKLVTNESNLPTN